MSKSPERKTQEPERRKDQVYIGQLSPHIREKDLRKEFEQFGKIKELMLKKGFAFIVLLN